MKKAGNKQSAAKTKEKKEKSTEIPLEISQHEFDELVAQVADLTRQEAAEELLDCARYGEVDTVRAILATYPDVINTVDDESGSTPLHKAAANGHVSTTLFLVQRGALLQCNSAGNTPLHWAAASGHDEVVDILLHESSYDVDVLQKNSFGRSVLTEGFASQCTEVVKLLLEHDSASEEKLLSGGKEIEDTDTNDEDDGNDLPQKSMASVTHDFDFLSADTKDKRKPLCIRELSIAHADNPFGDSAVHDTTGYGIWCASLAMARWMASPEVQSRFYNKTLLELGAGCGVPGLAAAHYTTASRVYVTDLNPTTVDNLRYNVDLNFENDKNDKHQQQRVIASTIDWDDTATWPKEKLDIVIGSDLIYQASIVPLLKKVVIGLLKPTSGRFLYVAPDTGRDGLPQFIESMKSDGCTLVDVKKAPDEYYANPLCSGDDEDCFLHFNELAASTYMLYEFSYENKD